MTDISVTATSVEPVAGYAFVDRIAGEAIAAGKACYQNSVDQKAYLADADDTAAKAIVEGIALNGAAANQPVRIQTGGDLDIGATLTVGEIYVLSGSAGGVAPEGDLANPDRVSIIGVATAADNLKLKIFNSGAVIPE